MTTGRRRQLDALTGLRFFTAFHIVMFHHGEQALAGFPVWIRNVLAGPGGVGLFFVLSGFILTYVYGRSFAEGRIAPRGFWLARFARIYPTYVLGLLLTAPFFFPAFFEGGSFLMGLARLLATVIPTLLLLQSWIPPIGLSWNGPDWAVSAMFTYYLLFPFVVVPLERWPARRLLGLAVVATLLTAIPAATVLRFPIPDVAWQEGLRVLPLTRLPEFLLGIALGRLYLTWSAARAARPEGAPFRGAPLTNVGTVASFVVMGIGLAMPYVVYKPLLVAGFGLLIVGLAFGDGLVARLLSLRPIVVLGHAGFPIYIFSLPIWGWCNRLSRATGLLEGRPFAFFVVYSVVLIGFSVLVLYVFENPLRAAIKRLNARRRAGPALTGD